MMLLPPESCYGTSSLDSFWKAEWKKTQGLPALRIPLYQPAHERQQLNMLDGNWEMSVILAFLELRQDLLSVRGQPSLTHSVREIPSQMNTDWWGGSVSTSACHQAGYPEFDSWDINGEFDSWHIWYLPTCTCMCVCTYNLNKGTTCNL